MAADTPRLCGGIFFLQILRMKNPSTRSKKDGLKGEKDMVNNQRILEALIQLFKPTFKVYADNTFKGDTSDYKSCKEWSGDNLPFDESRTDFTGFDNLVKQQYGKIMPMMRRFVNKYINTEDTSKVLSVCRALLKTIDEDETILPTDEFYMGQMGHPITKEQLLKTDDIIIESFLLGIWHFILLNRPNNLIGRDTFLEWHKSNTKGNVWTYKSKIGADYPIDIKVRRAGEDSAFATAETIFNEEFDSDTEYEEIMEDDQEEYTSESISDPDFLQYRALFMQQNFYNPTINNWYNAPGGTQAAYIENLTINRKN